MKEREFVYQVGVLRHLVWYRGLLGGGDKQARVCLQSRTRAIMINLIRPGWILLQVSVEALMGYFVHVDAPTFQRFLHNWMRDARLSPQMGIIALVGPAIILSIHLLSLPYSGRPVFPAPHLFQKTRPDMVLQLSRAGASEEPETASWALRTIPNYTVAV